ncbi:Cleavage and polyadenylation specificity factor [Paragonimus heterotremus]|uniref:Cleavage and polyadenylation specificity factor n=1 Tax=Paragonimus heterotremus TaxID=100268 RepID=A0A8J4WUT6_9TREM|nr:Cleavage and polyadenylation specificity factor [Paragonimus heterotremus]
MKLKKIQNYLCILSSASSGKLSESDFEDILQRNKTVSSSAINRAVQDAASGDYASAIETLVTAISLIKQSKIASDDRCRILINSLQDTLHGIESKSYGTKSSSRRRRRSYSDSGSDDGMDEYGSSSATSSRRHRDRGNRSRSRDRHDRHRHSRDRTAGSNTSYYGPQSSMQLPSGTGLSSGISISSVGNSGQGNCSGGSTTSSDRYRDSRYRH